MFKNVLFTRDTWLKKRHFKNTWPKIGIFRGIYKICCLKKNSKIIGNPALVGPFHSASIHTIFADLTRPGTSSSGPPPVKNHLQGCHTQKNISDEGSQSQLTFFQKGYKNFSRGLHAKKGLFTRAHKNTVAFLYLQKGNTLKSKHQSYLISVDCYSSEQSHFLLYDEL